MRALVTGCAGFIGSHLTEALLADGVDVIGVDCFNDNYQRPPKLRNLGHQAKDWDAFEFVPIDLSLGDLSDIVAEADVIFHLAAEPGVRASWGARFERYVRNNVIATQNLLEATKPFPETRFVCASSSSVYGDAETFPTPESVTPRPISPYGMTKLSAEHLCNLYAVNYGLSTVSLRYFTVYGPRQRPDMAFHRFCRAALRDEAIAVFGDGRQTRDFTFVDDIVAGTLAAAATDIVPGSVYNLGGGSQSSVRETLEIISELAGRELDVSYRKPEHGDVRDTSADTTAARRELGFEPATTLRQGLAAQFEWMRQTLALPAASRR
ncbi:MAG TPA: NAD-dependent epimerase/dehydratase family protein [Thermoleophilaceae bacterium]|jgi:nucleoside-diphosphate-sugar epimerase